MNRLAKPALWTAIIAIGTGSLLYKSKDYETDSSLYKDPIIKSSDVEFVAQIQKKTTTFSTRDKKQLEIIDTGNSASNELIIFLHGCPQNNLLTFWKQIEYFGNTKQYHIVCPNMRGYGNSFKSDKLEDYVIGELVQDVYDLVSHYGKGKDKVHIVGHDWGAILVYLYGSIYSHESNTSLIQNQVKNLVMINVAHPMAFLQGGIQQYLKSYYVYLVNIPGAIEFGTKRLEKDGFCRFFGEIFGDLCTKGIYTPFHFKLHQNLWHECLKYNFYWYRANVSYSISHFNQLASKYPHVYGKHQYKSGIKIPSLILHGEADHFLSKKSIQKSFDNYIQNKNESKLQFVPNASHWICWEQPQLVNEAIQNFIKSP